MKILIVNDYFWPRVGGVEKLGKLMMDGLEKAGHEVHVLTIGTGRDDSRFHEVKTSRKGWIFKVSAQTKKVIKEFKPDIIHALNHTSFGVAYAAKRAGIPAVTTGHEFLGKFWNKLVNWQDAFLYKWIEKMQIKAPFKKIVVPSRYTYDSAKSLGVSNERLEHIPNLLDKDIYKGYKWKGGDHFLFFGRLGKTKGVDLVIEAAREMPNKNFKLILSGPSKELSKFKGDVSDLKNVVVERTKVQKALFKEIEQCRAVIVPSRSEGFGYAAIDACMIGAPIIANRAGSLPEVVFGKVLFFEGGGTDLASKLKLANQNQFELRKRPAIFSQKKSLDKLIAVYEKLIRNYT